MDSWDVVVVGGGVVGLSAAWRLLEAGVGDVLVVESSYLGGGTTARGAGSVTAQRWNDTDIGLVRQSRDLLRRLDRETAGTFRWHPTGRLALAAEANRGALFAYARRVEATGERVDYLLPPDLARRFPDLALDDLGAGVFTPDDGYVYPPSLQQALAGVVRARGATIWEGVTVSGIAVRSDRAAGIRLQNTEVEIGARRAVLVCAGGGSDRVLTSAGAGVALVARPAEVAIALLGGIRGTLPGMLDTTRDLYTVPRNPGTLLVGAAGRTPGEGTLRERLESRFRGIGPIVGGWEGLVDQTPDGAPYIGAARGVEGLWVGCGLGGYGIMRGPAVGATLADLALGRPPEVDVTRYAADRQPVAPGFEPGPHELNPFAG